MTCFATLKTHNHAENNFMVKKSCSCTVHYLLQTQTLLVNISSSSFCEPSVMPTWVWFLKKQGNYPLLLPVMANCCQLKETTRIIMPSDMFMLVSNEINKHLLYSIELQQYHYLQTNSAKIEVFTFCLHNKYTRHTLSL